MVHCAPCPPDGEVPERLRTCSVDSDCIIAIVADPGCGFSCDRRVGVAVNVDKAAAVVRRYRHCQSSYEDCPGMGLVGCIDGSASCEDGLCVRGAPGE